MLPVLDLSIYHPLVFVFGGIFMSFVLWLLVAVCALTVTACRRNAYSVPAGLAMSGALWLSIIVIANLVCYANDGTASNYLGTNLVLGAIGATLSVIIVCCLLDELPKSDK